MSLAMRRGARAGRFLFYRSRGMLYIDIVRQWLLPVMGASAATKYMGLDAVWAVLFWVGVAICGEVSAQLIGWVECRSGATHETNQMASDTDPYRANTLQLLAEIRDAMSKP